MPDHTLTREQIRAALERHSDFWDAYGGAPAEVTDGIGMRLIQEDVPALAATALAAMEERDDLAARLRRIDAEVYRMEEHADWIRDHCPGSEDIADELDARVAELRGACCRVDAAPHFTGETP